MTPLEITLWWIALGIGLVVVLVVILLLSYLVSLVQTIDRGVVNVRDTLQAITGNTANTELISETAEGVDNVLAEGLQHHLFLTRLVTGTAQSLPNKVKR